MPIRKPLEKPTQKEIDIESLISKGASVIEDAKQVEKNWTHLNLRIPQDMLNSVELALKQRVGISRTGWILEAIHEKLKGLK